MSTAGKQSIEPWIQEALREGFAHLSAGRPNEADACEGNSIPWAPEYTAFAVFDANYPMAGREAFGTMAWSREDDHRGVPPVQLAGERVRPVFKSLCRRSSA